MIVDILVLAVLLVSALIAFLRGFIREVLTITGVVGGLAASYFGGPVFSPFVRGWLGVEDGVEPERLFGFVPYNILADALSYGVIFMVVVVLLSLLSHFLAETAKTIGLGAVDRTLGFVFGLLRGIVFLGLLYLLPHLFLDDATKEAWFSTSKTHFYLEKTASVMETFLPSSAVGEAEEGLQSIEAVSQTRKKLEQINLLKSDEDKMTQPVNSDSVHEGYPEEFRDKMDRLFEEQSGESNLNE